MTIIVLFWIMAIMDGWRGIKETWPAVVVAGGSFTIAQYLSSNFIGPELPDIISSLVSLLCRHCSSNAGNQFAYSASVT